MTVVHMQILNFKCAWPLTLKKKKLTPNIKCSNYIPKSKNSYLFVSCTVLNNFYDHVKS